MQVLNWNKNKSIDFLATVDEMFLKLLAYNKDKTTYLFILSRLGKANPPARTVIRR